MLIGIFSLLFSSETKASNAGEAHAMFQKAWNMAMGPNGCSLGYSVNIIGIYKTQGNIVIKGKKQHFAEKRYCAWNDGKKLYSVDLKKKKVELHNPLSPNRDKYQSKFTFKPEDYNYSWSNEKEGIVIALDAKKDAASSVRHAKVVLDRKTHYPIMLHIKVAFFWTKVYIYNFRSGNINDNVFVFPASKFKNFKFKNCWPD